MRVGISSCLLGRHVRYDGGHKREEGLVESLGTYVDWVAVCPEVEIGLGTPRPPIGLAIASDGASGTSAARLLVLHSGEDLTDRMTEYARRKIAALRELNLAGFVLKSGSPSCGLAGVALIDRLGRSSPAATGLFARLLTEEMPDLPVADEQTLRDPAEREDFLARVLAREVTR